jgi:hypothetical protein
LVSIPTYDPVDRESVGAATYTFKSRLVNVFEDEMRTPRLFPPPLEYTLMVDPFRELKEKDADESEPVPDALTPVTSDVPV